MFSYIDNKLINCFQWFVRQVELFTILTRKEMFAFLFLLYRYVLVGIFSSALLLCMLEDSLQDLPISIFGLFVAVRMYHLTKEGVRMFEQQQQAGVLPISILLRKCIRTLLWMVGSLLSFLVFSVSLREVDSDLGILLYFFLGVWIVIKIVIEYLLCTTSLPPGGKEKREQEKEMRNAVLDGV